jgi:hypothetical protein
VTVFTIAVIGVLGVWFLMTAVVQLPFKRGKGIRRYDPIGHLLPGWNFFAPKPIQADFAVWYRSWESYDEDRDEVLDAGSMAWRELAGIEQRRFTDAVLNPGRYTRKSIFTCCARIAATMRRTSYRPGDRQDLPPDAILMSLPYLLLAEKVSSLSRHAVAVQFRIDVVRHDGGIARASTLFRSAVHQVYPTSGDTEVAHVAASRP